jgi:hypothetical protein
MRCKSCDEPLTDFEATRKTAETKEYIELCNSCFEKADNTELILERLDLMEATDDKSGLEFDELYDTDFDIDGIPDISSYDT